MTLIVPPGFTQVALEFRHDLDPEPWYTTFGIDSSEAGGDVNAIGTKMMLNFSVAWDTLMSDSVQITGCALTVGQDGPDPVRAYVAATTDLRGNNDDEKLPQNCALLIRKNTALGGRRNRGRCFLPGLLNELNVSAVGLIDSGAVGEYSTAANSWLSNLGQALTPAGACPMVLLHSEGESAVPEPTVVTSLSVDNVISTQRRRLR